MFKNLKHSCHYSTSTPTLRYNYFCTSVESMGTKRRKIETDMNIIPDDIAGNILSFCEPGRYLTVGIVNKQFNLLHKKEQKVTTTLGYLESDTPLLTMDGSQVFPEPETLKGLMTSKCLHRLVKRTIERGLEWDPFCVNEAAEAGYKGFFKWLERTDFFWLPENAFASAAEEGNVDFMKFMVDSGYGFPGSMSLYRAEKHGKDNVIEWMDQLQSTKGYSLHRAIMSYDWRLVEELYQDSENHYDWMVFDAIAIGCYNTVEFFVSVGETPMDRDFVAAKKFHRDAILELLSEHEI